MTKYSMLDLAPIVQGGDAGLALRNARDLAQHAERWGFTRYWLAEHHNMPGIASAATAVAMAHVADGTSTIRIGAGGIMLPNHAPLIIAEQFGTLAALHPGRIDLGVGRAPGTDGLTAQALRRNLRQDIDTFPNDVAELMAYLGPSEPGQRVRAIPGEGTNVPVWVLGSSLYGAQLAAAFGLPYAFASHFAPQALDEAIEIYRHRFEPSEHLAKPYVMVGTNVFAADSAEEARRLMSSIQQAFLNLRRGTPGPLQPPVDGYEAALSPIERAGLDQALSCSAIGTADEVRDQLKAIIARTGADELMITAQVYDHAARLRSFEIAADVMKTLD
ncbi:LLM class flavin-dependent oxidoreductase [Sphingoaurantiacus capsulatus]|uniref:LLM class flavin-dependent oxidoreductase n=1 Tax=Sphingoaurantiacus capsulatus TaxID=1771310 RepID=A0ABV7XD19_9SPHN